jgi:type IV pilus assembly protein PilQ
MTTDDPEQESLFVPQSSNAPLLREATTQEATTQGTQGIARYSAEEGELGSPRRIPVPVNDLAGRVELHSVEGRLSLQVRQAPVTEVLALIAQQHGLNIVTGANVTGDVSVSLADAELEDAFDAILTVNGYSWVRQRNIIIVSKLQVGSGVSPALQGRAVRVFEMNYVAATDADAVAVVKGLLSPVGKSFVTASSAKDQRKTREQLVVEDLPEYLARVESYLQQIDTPPRQVLIEARVLQVTLSDETRHGVDFGALLQLANTDVTLNTRGFANPNASPAFLLGIDGEDIGAVIEALQATTDAKTLASPKVLAVNGQEARLQIGERLGYLVTTTTQTSTLQNVNFLDTGVVLTVTPIISEDGRILMTVVPKISTGRVNPDTGLPSEETTDVATTVILGDGQAMIIGGLITETDSDIQSKVPVVGDLWGVGRLFQKRQAILQRREIIIALIPRILPYNPDDQCEENHGVMRTEVPLTQWPLKENPRDFEPELPDAMKHPRRVRLNKLLDIQDNLEQEYPRRPEYFFPSPFDAEYYEQDE